MEAKTLAEQGGDRVSRLIRKQLHLHPTDVDALEQLTRSKGGKRKGYSFSREAGLAIREHIKRQRAQQDESVMTPVWQRLLDEKFTQLETWLRPGLWGGATYSTTAALMLLELMCGKTVHPEQARDYFELIRGRAWKIVRRDPSAHHAGSTGKEER